jgi:hypothetical protein
MQYQTFRSVSDNHYVIGLSRERSRIATTPPG